MSANWRHAGLIVLIMLMASGCAHLRGGTSAELADEYMQLSGWSEDKVSYELEVRERQYAEHSTAQNGLKLALVHGFAEGASVDRKRADELFEQIKAQTRDSASASMAALLKDYMQLRESSQKSVANANWSKVKLQRELKQLNDDLLAEQSRSTALEKKLEALKSIEQSIEQRD